MKKQKFNFENLKITEFYYLQKYVDKMIRLSIKNKDLDVTKDFRAIKRGLSISKDFIRYKIKEFQKLCNTNTAADEPLVKAITILKGMIRTDLAKEKFKNDN